MSKTINFCDVRDEGDPSAGIDPFCFSFNLNGLEVDDENIEELRNDVKDFFSKWTDPCGRISITFDFENEGDPFEGIDEDLENLINDHRRFEREYWNELV